jgi:hypothetical protein
MVSLGELSDVEFEALKKKIQYHRVEEQLHE